MKKVGGIATVAVFLTCVLTSPTFGRAELVLTPDQIQSHLKSVSAIDNYVFMQGRWTRDGGNARGSKPPRINTVVVTCDKTTMTCNEVIAELVTPQEESMFHKPQLYINETTYRVVNWTHNTIRATYDAPAAYFELRISIRNKMAERLWYETKVHENKTSSPINFKRWILQ